MRRISEYVLLEVFDAGATDAHGNPAESWVEPVPLGIYAFNPGTTSEPNGDGSDRLITEPSVYVPEGSPVGPRDRVTVRGVVYEVDGVLLDYRNPYDSSMDGCQANLREVRG